MLKMHAGPGGAGNGCRRIEESSTPRRNPVFTRFQRASAMLSVLLLISAGSLPAFTLNDLREDSSLTPEKLLQQFSDFEFKLAAPVQPAEQFLAAKAGDCDDFATLAADVLREKGYTPRLVAVFMPTEVHVVCYVKEVSSYLDFNNRKKDSPLMPTDGTLRDIANQVAASFKSDWRSVSEFTYNEGRRKFVQTDFR